jgi:hypothetical protein
MDACGQKRKTRVCQNRIYTLNMTVYLVISLPKNRIYIVTVYIYGTYIYIYIYIYIIYYHYYLHGSGHPYARPYLRACNPPDPINCEFFFSVVMEFYGTWL